MEVPITTLSSAAVFTRVNYSDFLMLDQNSTNSSYYDGDVNGEFINATDDDLLYSAGNWTKAVITSLQNQSTTSRTRSFGAFYWFTLGLNWLNYYYLGAIVVVGVLGNGFNVFSFLRTRNKLRSPSYYLAALALADAAFLLTIFVIWLGHFKITFFLRPVFFYTLVYIGAASSCVSGTLIHLISSLC